MTNLTLLNQTMLGCAVHYDMLFLKVFTIVFQQREMFSHLLDFVMKILSLLWTTYYLEIYHPLLF